MAATEEVLRKVDIAQLLTDIGFSDVDPTKSTYLGYCVFHNDTNTKSFSVNLDAKLFHCFGCRIRGNAIHLYAKWKSIEYRVAALELDLETERRSSDYLERRLMIQQPITTWRRIQILNDYIDQLPLITTTPHKKYLNDRCLSDKLLDKMGVRASKTVTLEATQEELDSLGLRSFLSMPVVLPYYRNSLAVFAQARVVGEPGAGQLKYLNIHGINSHTYNHDVLDKAVDVVYICEGVMDTLSMIELGYENSIGIPGVDAFKATWLDDFRCKRVSFAFDNDRAGDEAVQPLTKLFQQAGFIVDRFTEHQGFKDINKYLCHLRSSKI